MCLRNFEQAEILPAPRKRNLSLEMRHSTAQHQVTGPNMIVSYKLVTALLTLGLKVHVHRETHYYQEMYGASKGSIIIPGVTENSSK